MYVRLPDDYKFLSIWPERGTASPTGSVFDVTADGKDQSSDSPVTETAPQSVAEDADVSASQAISQVVM